MSDNKFILQLKGTQTPKSVVEIKNDKLVAPFTGVPHSTDVVGSIIDDKDSSVVVAKGAQNWKLNGSSLVVASSLSGDGSDYTGEFNVSGSGLWINAVYSLPATIFSAGTKWALKLCGKNLLTTSGQTIGFTLIVKIGNTHITSKTFTVVEGANVFCRQLVIDFSESEQAIIKAQSGDILTVQLLCSDANASATIYNGMTVFTALQRRVDADVVASDEKTFDEVVQDIDDINDEIDQIHDDIDNLDNTFVLKAGDTMTGTLNIADIASSNTAVLTLTHSNTATYKWNIAPRYNSTTLSVYPGSNETNGFRFATTGFVPSSNDARYLGSASLKWKGVYTAMINNGYDIAVPVTNSADTFALESEITDINGKIPAQASNSNQLADKNFVNSSIATNTANFIGTFNSVAELEAYSGTVTNNDYAFVIGTDTAGNTTYNRYKYNASTQQWIYEYTLNNSSFTAAQWATINSGGTAADVALARSAIQPSDLGNGTITITQGGTTKGTFTTNQSNNTTIDLDAGGGDVGQSIDASIVGTLSVAPNGDVSGFSITDYLEFPGGLYMQNASSFEIVLAFTITNPSGYIFRSPAGVGSPMVLQFDAWKLNLKVYNNSQNVNITGTTYLSDDTKYYVKVVYDGTDYILYLSTDGATWNQEATATATYLPGIQPRKYTLGEHSTSDSLGISILHMSECYIKKDGVLIWEGLGASGLQQRATNLHEVIEFQAPMSGNNYTWCRKYADGWVEQGGYVDTTNANYTATFPVEMADTNYTIQVSARADRYAVVSTNTALTTTGVTGWIADSRNGRVYWEVKGMAS